MDGPFKLTQYDATDNGATWSRTPLLGPGQVLARQARARRRSRPTPPSSSVLQGGNTINIGYVPPQDLPGLQGCGLLQGRRARSRAGTTPRWPPSTTSTPAYPWGVNYFALNYTNPVSGPIFKQLYVRQAMQSLMNQTLWIQLFNAGYGAPTYGPVPVLPADGPRHAAGELQPVPVQPHAREVAAALPRLEGRRRTGSPPV